MRCAGRIYARQPLEYLNAWYTRYEGIYISFIGTGVHDFSRGIENARWFECH